MARVPQNAVVVTPGGAITEEMILGHIVLFVVPNQPVPATKLARLWKEAGLDTGLIPEDRKAVNAFQVACRSVETRRAMNGSAKRAEVKVDEVLNDADACIYQVTRLVRDRENRVIEHPKAMRLTFDKSDQSIKTEELEHDAFTALKGLDAEIRDHFDRNAKRVPGAKIRTTVRYLLEQMQAQNLRRGSGGVYFAPRAGHKVLLGVKHVLDGLYGENADWHLLPCANGESEREMVARHLKLNVLEELAAKLAATREYLKSGKAMRSDKFARERSEYQRLLALTEDYKALLGTNLAEVDESLNLLQKQLGKLAENVDE